MKAGAIISLLAVGCSGHSSLTPSSLSQIAYALTETQAASDPENPYVKIEVFPVEREDSVYVAIRDRTAEWWGDFVCFSYDNGKIVWTASISERPEEQSILEARGILLPGFPYPFVEVFGITHMGNGCYYLYELRNRSLRLVLKTRAVDQNRDLNLIRGPHLSVRYRDINGDGCADVEFSGIVDEYSDDPHLEGPIRSYPCRKVFLWDAGLTRFVEERSQTAGFQTYVEDQD